MTKKKIGELLGTPIVTGDKNYANEHEYYMTLNGDNTYQKLEERTNGDKFRLVLGGGSDYPTPTAGDVNKVWQVTPVQKGTKTEEVVIVPEQTLVNQQELEYNDKFVPGAQCVAIIDGVEYRGEVREAGIDYIFNSEFCSFEYLSENEKFVFYNNTESPEVTAKLSVIEEVPNYDYNWAPGVKIPIPTAEDEGKILVVTKVEGDNTSTIVPEQEVPEDNQTPLTDVDLKYFVPGNTVTATVIIQQGSDEEEKKGGDVLLKGAESSNLETMIVSGIIEQDETPYVIFNLGQEDEFTIEIIPYGEPVTPPVVEGPKSINTKSSSDTEYILVTDLCEIIGSGEGSGNLRGNTIPYATIKLEYSESNYEYQLQENSGSGNSSSGFKYNELPEPTVVRELTEEDLDKLPSTNYIPANSSYGQVIDLDNGLIPDKLILLDNSEYLIMRLDGINTTGGGAEGVIWVYYEHSTCVVSADGSIMVSLI